MQNLIERALIMSSGPNLHLPLGGVKRMIKSAGPTAIRTLAEAERDHILEALRQVCWVVGGRNGAAARLGLPRTTLVYRMRKLGITQARTAAVGFATSQWDAPGAHTRVTNTSVRKPMEPGWLS